LAASRHPIVQGDGSCCPRTGRGSDSSRNSSRAGDGTRRVGERGRAARAVDAVAIDRRVRTTGERPRAAGRPGLRCLALVRGRGSCPGHRPRLHEGGDRDRRLLHPIRQEDRRVLLSRGDSVRIHLINPSDLSFGTAVITPRWLYVLAAATPARFGAPQIVDETLDPLDDATISPRDVEGIGIHTANALRRYATG